jgi:hypothetical protein
MLSISFTVVIIIIISLIKFILQLKLNYMENNIYII